MRARNFLVDPLLRRPIWSVVVYACVYACVCVCVCVCVCECVCVCVCVRGNNKKGEIFPSCWHTLLLPTQQVW